METLEGRQSVHAALIARRRRIQVILLAHGSHTEKLADLLKLAEDLAVPVKTVDRSELDSMAHGSSHGGIVAIASPIPRLDGDQLLSMVDTMSTATLLLLLEGVDDSRNLGFTLRTADALGFHAVLIKKHLWDFDPVEVGRPASGAYERLPLVQIENVDPLVKLQRRGVTVLGCIANARETIYQRDLCRSTVLCIGGEKRGLSGAVRDICDALVTIPTCGEPSSLSLSHAAAIAMGEASRQRRANPLF
jgi:23S rRNA (guanosine2251-2'-O)-methyltransferase